MARSHRPSAARALVASVLLAGSVLCPSSARAAPRRFALAMMHFNIQYVAGGSVGLVGKPDTGYDRTNDEMEDLIIRQSFEPVLDLFLKHPTWATDIEMQGYMLDVIAARHPAVLDKLRTLSASGAIDVDSFHYSDQLFVAHSPEDWRRSVDLDQATFLKWGVKLSPTVFCQEGQSSLGMAAAMKSKGYQTLVWPKNLFGYQHTEPPAPLYRFGDVQMITSNDVAFDDGKGNAVAAQWTFVNDGELLATGGIDPYFPSQFMTDPKALASYETQLSLLEASGVSISSVSKYVKTIQGVVPVATPPPLLDGTWQPNSTDGLHRWLGGRGVWFLYERDNEVRTLASLAHRELLAAETLARKVGLDASADIAAGFRLLALGEVSDATGINCFRGEVEYGIAHFTETLRIARAVIARARAMLGASATLQTVAIDTAAGTFTLDSPAPAAPPVTTAPPLSLTVDGSDRAPVTTWRIVDASHYLATVHFNAGQGTNLSVTVSGAPDGGDIIYTPALSDAPMHFPRAAFHFDHYYLPLHDGLVSLGGDWFVIKDMGTVHLAARLDAKVGDVQFLDETAPVREAITWTFHLVKGEQAAATVARSLNVLPTVWR